MQVFFYHLDVEKCYFVYQNPLEIVFSPPHYIIWPLCISSYYLQIFETSPQNTSGNLSSIKPWWNLWSDLNGHGFSQKRNELGGKCRNYLQKIFRHQRWCNSFSKWQSWFNWHVFPLSIDHFYSKLNCTMPRRMISFKMLTFVHQSQIEFFYLFLAFLCL